MRFHTNLPVRDIDKSIAFYSELFGVQPAKAKPDYAKFLAADGALNIAFHQAEAGPGPLSNLHLGFELPDQASLDTVYQRLRRAGLVTVERETGVCCYANQDKFWVTDPDGYHWELYRLIEDTELKMSQQSCCGQTNTGEVDTSACC